MICACMSISPVLPLGFGGAQGHGPLSPGDRATDWLSKPPSLSSAFLCLIFPICKRKTVTLHTEKKKTPLYQPGDKIHLVAHQKRKSAPRGRSVSAGLSLRPGSHQILHHGINNSHPAVTPGSPTARLRGKATSIPTRSRRSPEPPSTCKG